MKKRIVQSSIFLLCLLISIDTSAQNNLTSLEGNYLVYTSLSSESRPARIIHPKGSWEKSLSSDGSKPTPRHECAFVRVKNKFYLIGGRGIKAVDIYDTKTNKWTKGGPTPIEIHHFQPVVYKNKIYIMGGLTGKYPGETPIPNILIYDPRTDNWTEGPKIPENRNRGAAGVVVYGNKFYIVCGIKDGHRGDHKNWLDVYDPNTNIWLQLPDAPRPRDHFQAAIVQDKLYVMGGRRSRTGANGFSDTESAVDVFNFLTNRWRTLDHAPLPTGRAGNYVVVKGKYIVLMGGESGSQKGSHAETEIFNTKTESWGRLSKMIHGRHGTGAILYKGNIYVASGSGNRGGGPELDTMERWVKK